MGTVPMLCPYKMMFSGLIPYLAEDRAHQRPGTLPGDTTQGLLCSGHCTHKAPSRVQGLFPRPPPAPHGWAQGSSLHSQRSREQPGLSSQVSFGVCQGFPSPGQGYRVFTAAMWGSLSSESHCEPGSRKRRQSLAQGGTPNLAGEAELSLAQRDRKHSLCQGHAPQHPLPIGSPSCSL